MKKQLIICSLLFAANTIVCAQASPAKTTTAPAKTAAAEAAVIDLSPIGINATLKAPAGVKAVAGPYSNSIKDDKDFDISVEETSTTFAATKEKLSADNNNTIVASSDKAILYTTTTMGRNVAHFECIASINNVTYRLYDKRVAPLTKETIMPMYEAAKTITSK